jgi:hypothetical protein
MDVEGNCEVCGRGRAFSSTAMRSQGHTVHWMMWTCGHSRRHVVETPDEHVAASPELARVAR